MRKEYFNGIEPDYEVYFREFDIDDCTDEAKKLIFVIVDSHPGKEGWWYPDGGADAQTYWSVTYLDDDMFNFTGVVEDFAGQEFEIEIHESFKKE